MAIIEKAEKIEKNEIFLVGFDGNKLNFEEGNFRTEERRMLRWQAVDHEFSKNLDEP